jgi:hypothetical protein
MRLAALQSVIDIKVANVLGYLLPPGAHCFQWLGGFPLMLSPIPLRDWVHPLLSFTSPSECVLNITCLTTSARHLPGFLSPSRQKHMKSTKYRASHTRLRCALSVSHTLDALLLHIPCGLVSSHSHVRDSHFRDFPRCQAGSPHRRVVPSCRLRDSPPSELPHWCQILSHRLQGVDPGNDPLQKIGGLDLPTTRSPLGLSTPSGLCPNTLETPSRPLHL